MRLSNLNTFVKVMKFKSISRAAQELHLTQPAVTKQIKALEEYYGVVLTQRQDNQVIPTREGKKLYGYAVSILTENCELLNAFKSELDDSSGHIELMASNYPSQYIVPALITEMSGINEKMTYSIRTSHSQDVYYHVKNGIYTAGFVGSKKNYPNIESLGIDTSVRPKKQRLRKMSDEKTDAAKAEVHRLLEAKFIEPVAYPTWLSNVVMVQKKSGKWRMCIDFTSLNKACPKDNFPLPRIDKIVDSAAGCEVMSLLDCVTPLVLL